MAMGVAMQLRSLFAFHDLHRLKRAGKIIAVTFQGDDIRQGDRLKQRYDRSLADVVEPGYYTPETDSWKRKRITAFADHADLIYALNPDLLHDLPERARYLPYASVDPAEYSVQETINPRPVIVHAPSDRRVKGTVDVIAAISALKADGVDLDLRLVEETDNVEARRQYGQADIVIDQLHAGFYGSVAVEGMAMGKPVFCYLRAEDLKLLPEQMHAALPIINAEPRTLRDQIREFLASGRSHAGNVGKASRAFALDWHAPKTVASQTSADYLEIAARRS